MSEIRPLSLLTRVYREGTGTCTVGGGGAVGGGAVPSRLRENDGWYFRENDGWYFRVCVRVRLLGGGGGGGV